MLSQSLQQNPEEALQLQPQQRLHQHQLIRTVDATAGDSFDRISELLLLVQEEEGTSRQWAQYAWGRNHQAAVVVDAVADV